MTATPIKPAISKPNAQHRPTTVLRNLAQPHNHRRPAVSEPTIGRQSFRKSFAEKVTLLHASQFEYPDPDSRIDEPR